jgi:predicted secreted protein
MKRFIYFPLLFILLFSLQNCKNNQIQSSNSKDSTMKKGMEKKDNEPQILSVKVGKKIKIQLKDISTTGYEWQYEAKPDWIMSMVESYDYPSKSATPTDSTPPVVGASSMKTYIIEGLKKGDVNIRFYLVRPWEQNATPAEEKFYLVHVVD